MVGARFPRAHGGDVKVVSLIGSSGGCSSFRDSSLASDSIGDLRCSIDSFCDMPAPVATGGVLHSCYFWHRELKEEVLRELSSILNLGTLPKSDKASILSDAVRVLTQLKAEVEELKKSNEKLQEMIKDLKHLYCEYTKYSCHVAEKLSLLCILPLLLSAIIGALASHEKLPDYLRKLLVQNNNINESSWFVHRSAELIEAICFLCIFEEHHGVIFNILWEMVVSANVNMKINAVLLWKVPYIDVKVASTHVLPALVTLGSDANINVKYASIEAFGTVAQHFKNDTGLKGCYNYAIFFWF